MRHRSSKLKLVFLLCSKVIMPRRPFAKDADLDYDVMEDEEWEPEPEGDSLSGEQLFQTSYFTKKGV